MLKGSAKTISAAVTAKEQGLTRWKMWS